MDKGKIAEAIENLKSENDQTRMEAREILLEASLKDDGIAALQHKHYKALEDRLETLDRQLAATCLSRIHCSNLNNQEKVEWDRESLVKLRKCFNKSNRRDAKDKMLKAVRVFFLVEDQGQDKVRLLEETGWVKSVLCTDSYAGAFLLLDALHSHEPLPEAIVKAEDSARMLARGIPTLEEPERLAALRVALRVSKEGLPGVTQSEKQQWLKTLHVDGIVKALLSCIDKRFTETLQDSALRILTELAKIDDKFSDEMAKAGAVRVLATKALAKGDSDMILVLLRRLLMPGKFATALGNLGSSGIEVCLTALDNADPDEAKCILASLKTWCQLKPLAPLFSERALNFSRLVRFLSVQDPDVVQPTSFLVSLALTVQARNRSAALVMSLKEHNAVPTVLRFLATKELDATSAVSAIRRLGMPGPNDETVWDEKCTAVFVSSGCVLRVLEELRDGSAVKVGKVADLLTYLALSGKDIADEFVIKGAFEILSTRLATNKHSHETREANMLQAMNILLENADRKLVSEYCIASHKGSPGVRRLLEVIESSPQTQWEVLPVIAEIVGKFPEALDASMKAECMHCAVSVLGYRPPDYAVNQSLDTLACLLLWAKAPLGQTFIEVQGPELLYSHLKMESSRNTALRVVISIANIAKELAKVVDHLAGLSQSQNLASLCELYPPAGIDADERMKWHNSFEQAFNRKPNLPALGCP